MIDSSLVKECITNASPIEARVMYRKIPTRSSVYIFFELMLNIRAANEVLNKNAPMNPQKNLDMISKEGLCL